MSITLKIGNTITATEILPYATKTPFSYKVTIDEITSSGIEGSYQQLGPHGMKMLKGLFPWNSYTFTEYVQPKPAPINEDIVHDTIKWLHTMPKSLKALWAKEYPGNGG